MSETGDTALTSAMFDEWLEGEGASLARLFDDDTTRKIGAKIFGAGFLAAGREAHGLVGGIVERLPDPTPTSEADEVPPPKPSQRGTRANPCSYCGNTSTGNTLNDGWYRCNTCGGPSK